MNQQVVVKVEIDLEAGAVSNNMSTLYSRFESGEVKREDADTLANIAGKNLKALTIILAHKMLKNETASLVARADALKIRTIRLAKKRN